MKAKESFLKRLKEKRPDINVEDEELLYSRLNADYDDYEKNISDRDNRIKEFEDHERELFGAIAKSKDNAEYFDSIMKGEDILGRAVAIHGFDNLREFFNSEEARKKYEDRDREHKKLIEKNDELTKESNTNIEQTEKVLEDLISQDGYSRDQVTEAVGKLFDIADGISVNHVEKEWLLPFLNTPETKGAKNLKKKVEDKDETNAKGKPKAKAKPEADGGSLATMLFSR